MDFVGHQHPGPLLITLTPLAIGSRTNPNETDNFVYRINYKVSKITLKL